MKTEPVKAKYQKIPEIERRRRKKKEERKKKEYRITRVRHKIMRKMKHFRKIVR